MAKPVGFVWNPDSFYAYSINYPHIYFYGSISKNNIYSDYATKRVFDKLSKQVTENINSLETDYYVFSSPELSNTLLKDLNISIEDYFKEYWMDYVYVKLFLNQNNANIQNIVSSLYNVTNNLPSFNGKLLIYLGDSNLLTQCKEYIETHDKLYYEFYKISDDSFVGSFEINNGNVSVTEYTLKNMAGNRLSK